MILSRIQRAKETLTISGIVFAANASRQALSRYLNSMLLIEDWQRHNTLKSAPCQTANHSDRPLEVIRILLKLGVDPNVNTICGESSSLVVAVMTNEIDLAEILLDAGANITANV